jgi:hypothetical protein
MRTMNPLVAEYRNRLARHVSVAREAAQLLTTCVHEGGHWLAYAHYGVPVCSVYVDRRPGHMHRGRVVALDLDLRCDQRNRHEIDYVATMAGPYAEYLLTGIADDGPASAGDRRDAQEILLRWCGKDPLLQGQMEAYCKQKVEMLIGDDWPSVQALGYELMRRGRLQFGSPSPEDIHRQYGIGYVRRNMTARELASARRSLAPFHRTPGELIAAIANSPVPRPDHAGRTSLGVYIQNASGA